MSRALIPLRRLLDLWEEKDVESLLSSFCCARDEDLQIFLRDRAISYEKRDLSRTFLYVEDDRILGYISLAMTVLNIEDEWPVSNSLKRKMNLIGGSTSAYLIGQLCKADGIQEHVGETLLKMALVKLNAIRSTCGGRVICVDCKKDLIGYYERQGFVLISTESEVGLYRMVLLF